MREARTLLPFVGFVSAAGDFVFQTNAAAVNLHRFVSSTRTRQEGFRGRGRAHIVPFAVELHIAAAQQHIVARTAVKLVAVCAALQEIAAAAAVKQVVARMSQGPVAFFSAGFFAQMLVDVAGVDNVLATHAVNQIGIRIAHQHIDAGICIAHTIIGTQQHIPALSAQKHVAAAFQTVNHIVAARRIDHNRFRRERHHDVYAVIALNHDVFGRIGADLEIVQFDGF